MANLLSEQPLIVSLMLGALAAGLIYAWLRARLLDRRGPTQVQP